MPGRGPHPPWYDVRFKSTGPARNHIDKHEVSYLSDFDGLKRYMNKSDGPIIRELARHAERLRIAWRSAIPRGRNSSDGHFQDEIKVRKVLTGGDYKDRPTMEVYIDNPRYWRADVGQARQREENGGDRDTWAWQAIKRMERGGL